MAEPEPTPRRRRGRPRKSGGTPLNTPGRGRGGRGRGTPGGFGRGRGNDRLTTPRRSRRIQGASPINQNLPGPTNAPAAASPAAPAQAAVTAPTAAPAQAAVTAPTVAPAPTAAPAPAVATTPAPAPVASPAPVPTPVLAPTPAQASVPTPHQTSPVRTLQQAPSVHPQQLQGSVQQVLAAGGRISTPQAQQNSISNQGQNANQYPASLPSLVLDSSVAGSEHDVQHNVTNRSSWAENSAIQRIQPGADNHFNSLDSLLQDMVGVPFPTPIADFLEAHFKLNKTQQDLLLDLNYNSLENFVVYGALSVYDHVATVGRSYINNKDLALCIFVARVMAGLIHDQAQRSQHNALAVGKLDMTVDLANLPSYPPAIEKFLGKIDHGHVKRAVGRSKRRDVAGEIKHEIRMRLSDPHLGSVVEVRSQSGYIRNLERPDNQSVVSTLGYGPHERHMHQREDSSVEFVGQRKS